MLVFKPSSRDIVKNYFIQDGDKGKVIKVEEKDIESIPINFKNYITQVEVGPYNMNQRFPPGKYYFIWVEFSSYIKHLFITPVKAGLISSGNFFLYKEVEVNFNDPSGFDVW